MTQTRLRTMVGLLSAAVIGCGCTLGIGGSASAATAKTLTGPISSRTVYGYSATTTTDSPVTGEPFKTALVLTNTTAGKNPWDSGAAIALTGGAAKGDKVSITFYLRAIKPVTTKIEISIEQPATPYQSIARKTFTAAKAWQKETLTFTAPAAFTAAQEHAVVHSAFAVETVEIGGLAVVDKG